MVTPSDIPHGFAIWLTETKKASTGSFEDYVKSLGFTENHSYGWADFITLTKTPSRGAKLTIYTKLLCAWLGSHGLKVLDTGHLGDVAEAPQAQPQSESKEEKEVKDKEKEKEEKEPTGIKGKGKEEGTFEIKENTLLKIVTWNVRSLPVAEVPDKLDKVVAFLRRFDVICLQEISPGEKGAARIETLQGKLGYSLILGTGPTSTFTGRPLLNAILYSKKLTLLGSAVLRNSPHPTVVAYLMDDASGAEIVVSSTHLPYTGPSDEGTRAKLNVSQLEGLLAKQRTCIERLMAAWEVPSSAPMIIAGDFNHDPDTTFSLLPHTVVFPGKDVGTSQGKRTLDGFVISKGSFHFRYTDYLADLKWVESDHHPLAVDMGKVTSK